MPDDASAAGADCGAQRDLTFARSRPHEQEVGHVRTRDQQHECHGSAEDQQRRPCTSDEDRLHPFEAEATAVTEPVRKLGREFRAGELEPRLPLLERHTALEPRRGREEVALIDGVRIELERHPQLWRHANLGEIEVRADDADHFVRIAAQQNRLADDVGIAAEPPLPQAITDDRDTRAARQILLR